MRVQKDILFDLIEHKYFQRLRRIKQLGLTHMVYPGALHTRFHHALGSMHLMNEAIDSLKIKDIEITDEETEAVSIAILLHDIGHGPFSHSLENIIVKNASHEELSVLFMERLNEEFNGKLTLAIKIFKNKYSKKFLHQLVSSQLDTDRLDYLKRDSFYTGVSEGVIGSDRIIKMMNVYNDELVIEVKGIYSIEKFLIARRLMYWQVYLHKTVVSAEQLLIKILERAKFLAMDGKDLFATPALRYFLYSDIDFKNFIQNRLVLDNFAELDDCDIMASVKVWTKCKDKILSILCQKLINRELNKVTIFNKAVSKQDLNKLILKASGFYGISHKEAEYFVFSKKIENSTYQLNGVKIKIMHNKNKIEDLANASEHYDISVLGKNVKKYFLYLPKEIK